MTRFQSLDRSINPRGRTPAFAVATLLATLMAGCGSSAPPSTTARQSPSSPGAAAFKFAQCMRTHGVTNFPDPQVTSRGAATSIRQVAPASAVASPRFKSAQKACHGFEPAPGNATGGGRQPRAQVLLAFARCLRNHGFADFPDPDRSGQLSLQTISAAGVDYRSREFLTAAKNCLGVTHGAITPAQIEAAVNGPH
jgi:hypothetical protein